jgi:hypothetical protein
MHQGALIIMEIEHGEVTITVDKNIIIVKLEGAFNEFGAKKYTVGVKQIIDTFQGKPFSILINNLEVLGGTPEAYEELEKYNQWLNTQNLVAKAMVISSITTLDIINLLSPSRQSQQSKNFDNEEDAMQWLATLT